MAVPRQPGSVYVRRAGSAGTRSGARRDLAIQIDGLAEFRRALKSTAPDADKQFTAALRKFGVRAQARAKARSPYDTGRLESSIRRMVTRKEAALLSNLPYARAHEWGAKGAPSSVVRPRGVPIMIPRSQMLGNAVYYFRDALGYDLANLVNKAAERHGIETTPVRQSRWGGSRVISPSN